MDAGALYVIVRCDDSEPGAIRGRTVTRDTFAVFSDDAEQLLVQARLRWQLLDRAELFVVWQDNLNLRDDASWTSDFQLLLAKVALRWP